MGINGLLQALRPICEKKHVKEFARRRVGIDIYGWIHKGAFSCAGDLCTGKPTTAYVRYCMDRVKMLQHFEVIPVLVFDGASLPMKSETHKERRERKARNLEKGNEALRQGNIRAAEQYFQGAFPVTSDMVRQVMKECRKNNVEFIVAPYEADAQLAWMAMNGNIDCVLTEDSDLVVYGAPKILYKMTGHGDGDLFQVKNLASLDKPPMFNITPDMFMWMCVCSGCDFFEGVKNLGIIRAHGLVKRQKTLSRLLHSIRADIRYGVSREFMTSFYRACLVFRHQTVFEITSGKAAHLAAFDPARIAMLPSGIIPTGGDGEPDLNFLGAQHSDSVMQGIARGEINPTTLEKYEVPLDVIERPLEQPSSGRTRRPALAASATRNSHGRGLQVLPAKNPSSAFFKQSSNLRSRLARGPMNFNPRKIASNLASRRSNPRQRSSVPSSGSIWSRFKRPRKENEVEDDISHPFGIGKDERLSSHVMGNQNVLCIEANAPAAKRAKRHSSTERRSGGSPLLPKNSVKRFTNRFASRNDDKKSKSSRASAAHQNGSVNNESFEFLPSGEPSLEKTKEVGETLIPNAFGVVNGETEKTERVVLRSRFFAPDKRITLSPSNPKTVSGQRALVRDVASSVRKWTGSSASGKQVRGRAVINTSVWTER